MRINHNIAALNTYNKLSANQKTTAQSLEKLSSGLKINRAGDDAAGLAISEKMRGQIRGLDQATNNSSDGISLIKTAEGGLNETHSILQRMRELAVQSANDTNTEADRGEIQKEVTQLSEEITRIANNTNFNNKNLLDGTLGVKLDAAASTLKISAPLATVPAPTSIAEIDITGADKNTTYTITAATDTYTLADGQGNTQQVKLASLTAGTLDFDKLGVKITVDATNLAADLTGKTIKTTDSEATKFQIGANSGQSIDVSIGNMNAAALGVDKLNIGSQVGASSAIDSIDAAIKSVSSERGMLGAVQNRLEHTINNLGTSSENLSSAESRIRDVDMAKEMMEFTKNNILSQAAQSMLAQANQQPQGVLQLLQ